MKDNNSTKLFVYCKIKGYLTINHERSLNDVKARALKANFGTVFD